MILMMLLMVLIMADPSLSSALGSGMALLLNPTIGFGGHLPVVSILLAGAITGVLSTGLRHWSTDYIALERGRVLQRTFQKELMDARAKRDVDRVERLRRAQPFMMSHTMSAQYATMKPAIGTMVVALAVYGWMIVFLRFEVPTSGVSLPWTASWELAPGSLQMMFLYAIMSLPLTVVLSSSLKLWRFRHFDPKAPLPSLPTVDDLVRRAEGEADNEDLLRRESDKARKRLKAVGAAAAGGEDGGDAPPTIEDDARADTTIVDEDEADIRIVDPEEPSGGEAPVEAARRGWRKARLAEPPSKGVAQAEEK